MFDKMISKSDLEYWYVHKEESIDQLKKRFHCGHPVLFRHLKMYDIPIRTQSEANRIMVKKYPYVKQILLEGSKYGNRFQRGNISQYRTGISILKQVKGMLETPFCHICGVTKHNLVVHHLDFNRLNNQIDNLIILCQKCHMVEHNYYRQFADGRTTYESDNLNEIHNGLR